MNAISIDFRPIVLGNRQELFCQQILKGKSITEAYRIAYGAPQRQAEANGSRLMRNDRVVARIDQLKAHEAAAQRVTLPFLTKELLATANEARAIGQPGAANGCYQTVAKMHGLFVDKIQLDVAIRKPSASPDSPDDMTESQWLESAGLVIEHMTQSHDQSDPSTKDGNSIDHMTSVDQMISTPGLHPESGGTTDRGPGAERSHPVDEAGSGGDPPPPLPEVAIDTLYTKEPESQTPMPMKSEKQRKAMHAAAAGKSTAGIPKAVAKKFVAHDSGGKLPKKATKRAKK